MTALVEIVISLFLVALVLGMVSTLLTRTFDALRFLQQKGQTFQSATLGGERLTSEMAEMTELRGTSPLEFAKANPLAAPAVENDPNNFLLPASSWARDYSSDASGDNQRAVIRYRHSLTDEHLERTATFGSSQTSIVATAVNTFTVTQHARVRNSFEVRLSINERQRVFVFVYNVICPGLDQ